MNIEELDKQIKELTEQGKKLIEVKQALKLTNDCVQNGKHDLQFYIEGNAVAGTVISIQATCRHCNCIVVVGPSKDNQWRMPQFCDELADKYIHSYFNDDEDEIKEDE